MIGILLRLLVSSAAVTSVSAAGPLVLPAASQNEVLSKRDVTGASTVHLGENTGNPQHLASGFIYGMPDNETQIPDHFYTDIGFWNTRTGGAQLPAPCRGWTYGYDEFLCRMQSTIHNYHTARKYGANFQVLLHDLWGIDGYANIPSIPTPGDNGDWQPYNDFLSAIFQIFIDNNVIEAVYFDITNEIDNTQYYGRGMERYFDVWGLTFHRIAQEFPEGKSVGPSFGNLPDFGAPTWYSGWANFTNLNASIPTWMTMHFLEPTGNLERSIDAFQGFLTAAGVIYNGPFVINEYGNIDQQFASGAAWNIAQLERHNAIGLRANWRGDYELHDYMANLIGKKAVFPNYNIDDADYWTCREYPVYKYYNLNMTGFRVRTESTPDTLGDTYAVIDSHTVRILAGARPSTGSWAVIVSGMSAVGLPTAGEVSVHTWRFETGDLYDEIDGPTDMLSYTHSYYDDALYLVIDQSDPGIAFAFEFSF